MDSFATDIDALFRSAAFVRAGRDDRGLRRAAASGDLVRVLPGVFVDGHAWASLNPRARHLVRARALRCRLGPRAAFSHSTAAALHGLPTLRDEPDIVDVTDADCPTTRVSTSLRVRSLALSSAHVTSIGGLPVTDLARTAVDIALALPIRDSVVALDPAFGRGGITRDDFELALKTRLPVRANRRVEHLLEFVDAASGSPGESFSRVVMDELGFPRPILQQPFFDGRGKIGEVDFWWPDQGVIGEFDGQGKYLRDVYLQGRTPGEVVVDEKNRENRLRAHPVVRGFARWEWGDVEQPERLKRVLVTAGLKRAAGQST